MKLSFVAASLATFSFMSTYAFAEQPAGFDDEITAPVVVEEPVVIVEAEDSFEFPRLEKMSEDMQDEYEADKDAFLRKMLDEPINYELVNQNLNKTGAVVSENSTFIKSVNIKFDSVLTKAWHKNLTLNKNYPELPFLLPLAKTTFDIDVKLNPNTALPIPVNGFSLGLRAGQTPLSLRGILNLGLPTWTDTYSVLGSVDLDSLQALKLLFANNEIQDVCKNASDIGIVPSEVEDSKKYQEAVEKACLVVAKGTKAENFDAFLAEVKEPIQEINDLIAAIIDETWKESVGGGAWSRFFNFASKAAYSYKIGVQDCSGFVARNTNCEPNLFFKGSGGILIGDVDGSLVISKDKVAFEVSGELSGGVRADAVGEKKDLAAYVYIAAKVVESANDEEISKLGLELAEGLENLAELIQEDINDELD